MILSASASLATFAKEQGDRQTREENDLFGSAKAALRRYKGGVEDWYQPLLHRAEALLRAHYREQTGRRTSSPALREFVDAFAAQSERMLKKTKTPTDDTLEAQARTIAATLSTHALNAAVEAAGYDDDTDNAELEKVWASREDDKVRPSHAAADGQAVPMDGKFEVGGAKMSRPGDTSAPIEQWANCRCVMAVRRRQSEEAVVAAAAEEAKNTGVGIFLIPAEGQSVHDLSTEDQAHTTLLFFGSIDDLPGDADMVESIKAAAKQEAAAFHPVDLHVTGRDTLGRDEADVVMLDGEPAVELRDALLAWEPIKTAFDAFDQYPDWLAHLTLGYPENPSSATEEDLPETIHYDRLGVWVGDEHYEYALGGDDMAENTDQQQPQTDQPPPPPAEPMAIAEDIPWHGVWTVEDTLSGDGRKFVSNALRRRPLPLPLATQRTNEPGHDGSVVTAVATTLVRVGTEIRAAGHFIAAVPETDEIVALLAEFGRFGVSIDADDAKMEMQTKDGQSIEAMLDEMEPDSTLDLDFDDIVTAFTDARICGATTCAIPAFHEAWVALGEAPEGFLDGEDLAEEGEAVVAGGQLVTTALVAAPGTEDGPGWITHPVDTDRLRDYWTKGEGAAKIAWGTPGDFNRCRANLAPYVKPNHLSGYCANRHKDALGVWPGQEASVKDSLVAAGMPDAQMAPAVNLVASAAPNVPPREWFDDPQLAGPSPIVVTEDGHVFGHIATWGTCHIGMPGTCVTPPQSVSNYAYFRLGSIQTTGGPVAVGQLTMGTGHAPLRAGSKAALAHYDNTGTAVCDVASGEDAYGIWVAGAVRPTATEEQVRELRASKISGDWRDIGGSLELVAALCVNVPGFPIPRTSMAASAGHQTALVAAGIVPDPVSPVSAARIEEIVAKALVEHEERKVAKVKMETLAAQTAKRRMAALAAGRK